MVKLIASAAQGKRVCAAAARLSTKSGGAYDLFASSEGGERDVNLIKKVISSGHKSLLEHQSFSFALDGVSVFVEQCLIEFRLASFTVKSRRYVDFKSAGYYVPTYLEGEALSAYLSSMDALFDDYARLVDLGIPKEDARFVLPYCFFSNMYLTCNARELIHIIKAMSGGRLSAHEEARTVAGELAAILENEYPGVLELENERTPCKTSVKNADIADESISEAEVSLTGQPLDAGGLLKTAMALSGRYGEKDIALLAKDSRPRELECLSYTFLIKNISQSCVTHFARHRIQSPIFEGPHAAISRNGFILPATVASNEQAKEIYLSAFKRNTANARRLIALGLKIEDMVYLSLSGNTVDALITMNAREIRHFMNLRTCERAQWEIRKAANDMLTRLTDVYPELFKNFGPSCLTLGACPEGRLSCGHPRS